MDLVSSHTAPPPVYKASSPLSTFSVTCVCYFLDVFLGFSLSVSLPLSFSLFPSLCLPSSFPTPPTGFVSPRQVQDECPLHNQGQPAGPVMAGAGTQHSSPSLQALCLGVSPPLPVSPPLLLRLSPLSTCATAVHSAHPSLCCIAISLLPCSLSLFFLPVHFHSIPLPAVSVPLSVCLGLYLWLSVSLPRPGCCESQNPDC